MFYPVPFRAGLFRVCNRASGEQDLVFALKDNPAGYPIYELNLSHDFSRPGLYIGDSLTGRGYDLNPKAKRSLAVWCG